MYLPTAATPAARRLRGPLPIARGPEPNYLAVLELEQPSGL